jgi:hypothetical protein
LVGAFEKTGVDRQVFVQTDQGTEFLNSQVQSLFRKYGVRHYWTQNTNIKAAICERFNRTLRTRMYRYFTSRNTKRWIDVLPQLIKSYNNTYHRTIGMAPNEVTNENAQAVSERMFPMKTIPKYKFNIGDKVRIPVYKNVFAKGFTQNWTLEIFVVSERHVSNPPTYSVTDLLGETIKGRFYEHELQKIDKKDDDTFIVEKVLKTRKRDGIVEHFVKWQGYDARFNSWTRDLHAI